MEQASAGLPYPNPFWPALGGATHIDVSLAQAGGLTLRAYDVTGVLVRTIAAQDCPNGKFSFSWDGRNDAGQLVATGIYFILVQAPGVKETKLVGVLK